MAPVIIAQRHVPACGFLIVASAEPEIARSILAGSFSRTRWLLLSDSPGSDHLEVVPRRFWSLRPRVNVRLVPSVAGSNVHVRLQIRGYWWLLLAVLTTLAAVAGTETSEIVAASLLGVAVIALAAVVLGLLEAKRLVVVALTEHGDPALDDPERVRRRVVALAVVTILALTGFVGYRRVVRHRDVLLARAAFAPGVLRQAVLTRLGAPDLELVGGDIRHGVSDPPCATRAGTELDYFGSRQGLYCAVYLDAHDRVLCVDHGAGLGAP